MSGAPQAGVVWLTSRLSYRGCWPWVWLTPALCNSTFRTHSARLTSTSKDDHDQLASLSSFHVTLQFEARRSHSASSLSIGFHYDGARAPCNSRSQRLTPITNHPFHSSTERPPSSVAPDFIATLPAPGLYVEQSSQLRSCSAQGSQHDEASFHASRQTRLLWGFALPAAAPMLDWSPTIIIIPHETPNVGVRRLCPCSIVFQRYLGAYETWDGGQFQT